MRVLSERERVFLTRRKRLVAVWNSVAAVMLISLVGLFSWIFIRSPYLANPVFVAETLERNEMQASMMTMAALLLPIVFITLFVTVGIFILFGFVIFSNEKRYISMIERLLDDGAHD